MKRNAPYSAEAPCFEVIAGAYARPASKRVFLHRPGDVCIVEARPDFTFLIKDAISPGGNRPLAGFGFLYGPRMEAFDIDGIARSFVRGSIPILSQSIACDGILITLTSLCAGGKLWIRLTAASTHPECPQSCLLYFSAIQTAMKDLYEHSNEDYVPYRTNNQPWLSPLPVTLSQGVLLHKDTARAVIVSAEGFAVGDIPQGQGRLVCVQATLQPGEQAAVELAIPYGPVNESKSQGYGPDSWRHAYAETLAYYSEQMQRGTRLRTPEPIVNRLFDTLRLSSLQMLGRKEGSDFLYPGQGGYNAFNVVYGMETSCWLPVLDQLGYDREVKRAMDYLLTTQHDSPGPDGDIADPTGSFRPHIHWMCETGAILTILCSHALYSQDEAWFDSAARQLMSACRFIMRERARTKALHEPGRAGYGLLPKGRPHDWPDYGQFLFSDAYTWKGLNLAAQTFTAFGHPDGSLLTREAEDYKKCILDSFHQAAYPHPDEPGRLWFSSEVHTPAGKEVGCYGGDGPVCLVDTGILPADDPLVAHIEWDAIRRGFMTPLFCHVMSGMESEELAALQRRYAGGDYDLIYVTFSESMWQKAFLEQGRRSRALTYFYSTLAYATTYELGITHERFCPQLPWLLPWQPNASANGRILAMMTRNICFETDAGLYLLAGVPDRWLQDEILLEDYAIIGGRITVKTSRSRDKLTVETSISRPMPAVLPRTITYCLPEGWIPRDGGMTAVPGKKGWYRDSLSLHHTTSFMEHHETI